VVLLHGWPLDSQSWAPQIPALLQAGHRVITYDRRRFGRSSRPATGYVFDTLAEDLGTVLGELDLRHVTVVTFSLGTGELARYIGKYGTDRLKGCIFIESLAPSFARSAENPHCVDEAAVAALQQAIRPAGFAWLTGLLRDFLNLDDYLGKRVSEDTVRASWNEARRPHRSRPGRARRAGSTTSAATSRASMSRFWSCTAPPTGSSRSTARAGGCTPRCPTHGTSRSTAGARRVRHPRRGGQPPAPRIPAPAGTGHEHRVTAPRRPQDRQARDDAGSVQQTRPRRRSPYDPIDVRRRLEPDRRTRARRIRRQRRLE
jgi:pimeloyl-ACP methyl ester carboxylesterase